MAPSQILDIAPPTRHSLRISDFVELCKPGILGMCVFTAVGGMGVATTMGAVPTPFPWATALWGLLGTTLSVSGANTLNQYIEREGDKLMNRTKDRPLPTGRMNPTVALVFGIVLAVLSEVILFAYVNPLTAWLSAFALVSYVLIYTPMKRRSTQALIVGAVPGAMPPLLGWTIVTNEIGVAGVVLFLILLIWQLPHFLAISIYRRIDYEAAGIKVVPNVRGVESAKNQSLVYSLLLFTVSMILVPLGVAGFTYFVAIAVLGAWFFVLSMRGFEPGADNKWARQFFFASLVYLPVLTVALVIDILIA